MQLLHSHDRSRPAERLNEEQFEKLGEILDQLLMQAEAGDTPDIEAACQKHPDLASSIRHYVRSMQLLHNAAHAKSSSSGDSSRINLLAPPERELGDYRLVREIGRGGMGIVYEAQQLSLSRRVALKILPFAAVLDSRQITRFQNEAQAAASLHHPHIVPVYAVGHERGTYYYSMQYIDGQTLEFAIDQLRHGHDGSLLGLNTDNVDQVKLRNASTLIARGSQPPSPVEEKRARAQTIQPNKLSSEARAHDDQAAVSTIRMQADASTINSVRSRDYVRRVAQLGIQAAEALHYAHENGIVHRDIKPSNLMLDASGNLWVTDFGLAQCATSHNLTRSGDVIGTLRYMSPEQAAGRTHLIDHRTDVYALGATLYELLTLRAVVDASDRNHILRQIEHDSPRGLRRFNSAVPLDLENIVLKAIAKGREERYVSAGELAEDLKRFLADQTPLARRPTLLDHSARWIRRHARAVAVAGLVLCVLLTGAVTAAMLLQSKNREIAAANTRAEHHLLRANEAVYQFGNALMHRLELLPGSEQVRAETARDAIAYFQAFASYAHDRSLLQADVARALMLSGDLELQLGEAAAAVDHYRQASDIWSRMASADRTAYQLLCQNNLASCYAQLGQLYKAKELLQAGLRLRPTHQDDEEVIVARTLMHLNLGHVHIELNATSAAQNEFESALELLDSINSLSGADLRPRRTEWLDAQLTSLLSAALVQSGQLLDDPEQARELLERAVALDQRRAQNSPSDMVAIHDGALARLALGAQLLASSEPTEARRVFHKAAGDMRGLVNQHPAIVRFAVDLASALNNLGQAELDLQSIPAAEQNFVESKELLTRLYPGSEDYWIASNLGGVCNNLAIVKEQQGQREAAEHLLEQAIKYQEAALAMSPDSTRCREFLAEHRAQLARLVNEQPKTIRQ